MSSMDPHYTPPLSYARDDEIDLFELMAGLWQRKLLIILITAVVTAIGTAYAFMATPYYESTAYVLPPLAQNISELKPVQRIVVNEQQPSLYQTNSNSQDNIAHLPYSTEDTFKTFITAVQSNTVLRNLANQSDIKAHLEKQGLVGTAALNHLRNAFKIKAENEKVQVTATSNQPDTAAVWANQLIILADQLAKEQLVERARADIQSQLATLENQLASKKALFLEQIKTELAQLREAYSIAERINLQEPLQVGVSDQASIVNQMRNLYRLGTKALSAEINALEARAENARFMPDNNELLQQQALLKRIKIHPERINTAHLDQAALPAAQPVKPRKALLIALSLVMGGMLALMTALVLNAIAKRREQHNQA